MVGIVDEGAGRDFYYQVVAVCAVFIFSGARPAVGGAPVVLAGEIEQGVEAFDGLKVDVAAPSAVAAVRAALGDVFLAAEADAAVAAVARLDVNFRLVNKHSTRISYIVRGAASIGIKKGWRGSHPYLCRRDYWFYQVTCTFRPLKCTVPSAVAKRV